MAPREGLSKKQNGEKKRNKGAVGNILGNSVCCGGIFVWAGHGCPEALGTQACRAGTGRTISPASLGDVFMIHHRAAPPSASAVPQLAEL